MENNNSPKRYCPMCEGLGFVQRADTIFEPCPRCEQTGAEPPDVKEVVIVMRCFFSKSKNAWINQLNVTTSHADIGPVDVAKLMRDYLDLIEQRQIVILPPGSPKPI